VTPRTRPLASDAPWRQESQTWDTRQPRAVCVLVSYRTLAHPGIKKIGRRSRSKGGGLQPRVVRSIRTSFYASTARSRCSDPRLRGHHSSNRAQTDLSQPLDSGSP